MSASLSGASERSGTAAKPRAAGQLGKYAKSATPPSDRRKIRATRAQRYQLLSAARCLFLFEGKRAGLVHPGNFHRTAKCRYIPHGSAVGVHASEQHASAFFSGLVTCGSVWACPVCAAKVQERRREEIAKAIEWAYDQVLQPVMVTLTFPHYAWDTLQTLISQQADALHRLRAGAPWSRVKADYGYVGLIRGLELTFGQNGWHPHTHEIWLVSPHADADELRERILERWRLSCARAGLLDLANSAQVEAFNQHAVDVKGWCDTSDYLAKQDESRHWGADREMAKSSTKAGRAKGVHPFALLADAAEGDRTAGAKFVEYAVAMKGKAQLFWSRGLKATVGIAEMSDEEVAEDERDNADLLGLLNHSQWVLVRGADQRAELLEAAEESGWPGVLIFLAKLQKKPPAKRGPRLIGTG